MNATPAVRDVLVVGATGSVGRRVVAEALARDYRVRGLVRDEARGELLPPGAEPVLGDLTRPESLRPAAAGVDAVVLTHGAQGTEADLEAVDYGGVRDLLAALDEPARLVLMTAIGITNRDSAYNRSTHGLDWKRRSERLVRASGNPFTIVRPGWFDYQAPDENRPLFLQGDRRRTGEPRDGAVSRGLLARVLVAALADDPGRSTTFELIAEPGVAPADLAPLFAALEPDRPGALDGVQDEANLPLDGEPQRVLDDLEAAGR